MTEADKTAKKHVLEGRRKGGRIFPRINLAEALEYSAKLVSKTHTGPQTEEKLLPGVFNNRGSAGKVRASALKQFGLMQGKADAYEATELAKSIQASPTEEKTPLLQRAFRTSKLFNDIFETFHGDTITKAKIRQQAQALDVHPDSAEECLEVFTASAVTAGLASLNGDSVTLQTTTTAPLTDEKPAEEPVVTEPESEPPEESALVPPTRHESGTDAGTDGRRTNKAGVTVTLNVDSSSDPDKLQKQLELLRRFGMI